MKKLSLFSLLPLLCLSSCGKEAFSYSKVNDLTKDYLLFRNDRTAYWGKETKANDIIYRASKGEGVLFVFLSDTCSACNIAKTTYKEALRPYDLDVSIILNNTNSEADAINNYVARKGIEKRLTNPVMSGATPSMYLLNDKVLTEVIYGTEENQEKDSKKIRNTLKAYTSITTIYRAKEYESLKDLTYFFDSSVSSEIDFFYDVVFPKALTSTREISYVDIKGYSTDDIDFISGQIGESVQDGLIYNKKTKLGDHYRTSKGIEILNSYFA